MELVVGQIHRTIEQNGELGKKSPQTCSTDLTKVQKQCNSPENGTYIIVFNNDDRTIAKKKKQKQKKPGLLLILQKIAQNILQNAK